MEDTLQRFFAILVAVVIFFLLPLYIAFEKKDDISYSLALKITSNFVNDVKNKGYITRDMYNDFISDLAVTGNSYDIKMEHVAKNIILLYIHIIMGLIKIILINLIIVYTKNFTKVILKI